MGLFKRKERKEFRDQIEELQEKAENEWELAETETHELAEKIDSLVDELALVESYLHCVPIEEDEESLRSSFEKDVELVLCPVCGTAQPSGNRCCNHCSSILRYDF